MDEVSDYVMERGRAALTKRFASAHERLAVSTKIDGALLSTAFDGCFHHVTAWALMAHERLGAQLSTAEKNQVADAVRVAATRAAIDRGEQPSLAGIGWPDWSPLAERLDRKAFAAWNPRRVRPKHEPYAVFRALWHASQGTPDAELTAIVKWAIGETRQDRTWGHFSPAPKATRTKMRNELIELLQQAEARVESALHSKLAKGHRVGQPAKELGAIVAAYARVKKLGGLRGIYGRDSDDGVIQLMKAIEASGVWQAYVNGEIE
jgi:hypothetical protein